MATKIDVVKLVQNIEDTISKEIGRDIKQVQGFSKSQLEAIARQADYIAEGIKKGEIGDDLREFFLQGLKDMVENFVNVLVGLIKTLLQQIWNATVNVIWKAISDAVGFSVHL